MSGLSLASHPPSGGRRAAPLRRKQRCLRARLVCACPACPPLWGFRLLCFMPVAPARARGSSCAHTSCLPTRSGVGALCVRLGACLVGACCGRVCLRVDGFRVYARGVFAFWCLRALVLALWCGGGTVWSRRPCPACLVGAHVSGVGLLACAVVLRARWARGRSGRGGTIVSRPIQRGVRCPAAAWRGERGKGWGCSPWCANTRAHAQRRGRGGGRGGASWGGPWWPGRGLWVCAFWCMQSLVA